MPNPPKPSHLKLLQGTYRKDRANPHEPRPVGGLVDPPDWLSDKQRMYWQRAIAAAPAGLLKRLDEPVLVSYAVSAAALEEATLAILRSGIVVKGTRGAPVMNPYIRAQSLANIAMMRACSEMGFTPASRTRVSVRPDESPDEDPWLRLAAENTPTKPKEGEHDPAS
jgi:P27 family predicted phage terminase small subunit